MKWYALLPAITLISVFVRALPFFIGNYLRRYAFLHKLSVMLPACLLVMITAFSLHNVDFKAAPFGLPEIIALACVALTQTLFRTITISMAVGVVLHQVLRVILLTS